MTACCPRHSGVRPLLFPKELWKHSSHPSKAETPLQQPGSQEGTQLQKASGAGGTSDLKGSFAAGAITATHSTGCEGDGFQPEAYKQASSANWEQRKRRSEKLISVKSVLGPVNSKTLSCYAHECVTESIGKSYPACREVGGWHGIIKTLFF